MKGSGIRALREKWASWQPDRKRVGMTCGMVGICLNVLLFAGKFILGLISHSVAVSADAFNNLSDAGSSLLSILGFHLSAQRPDSTHPYGHGRIEYVASLLVAMAVVLMGGELILTSVRRIFHPQTVIYSSLMVSLLVISIVVKGIMYTYNHIIGRKMNSTVLLTTAADSLGDAASTSVVLVSVLISRVTDFQVDGWCGILVGALILYSGIMEAKKTIDLLLGEGPNSAFRTQVRDIVLNTPYVMGIHDLIVHDYGPGRRMISLHAEVPADGNFVAMHNAIDGAEREIYEKLSCNAVIHMDPVTVGDPLTDEKKQEVLALARELNPSVKIHDFRMVKGTDRSKLIFDAVFPYEAPQSDAELKKELENRISQRMKNCYGIVNIDRVE